MRNWCWPTLFLFNFNSLLSFPHMLIGRVWICRLLFVCFWLFVNLSLCTVTDFSAGDKPAASNFARWFMGDLGMESPILRNFTPPEAQNPTNRRPFWKYVLYKKAPYQRSGSPDTLDTPWIRPCGANDNSQHLYKQVAQLSLTKPRDALHHDKRQNFKTGP